MAIQQNIQNLVYALEHGLVIRTLKGFLMAGVLLGFSVLYTASQFHGLNTAEAMESAALSKELALGRGYQTKLIRPFIAEKLFQSHQRVAGDSVVAFYRQQQELITPPVYPYLVSMIMRMGKVAAFLKPDGATKRYWPDYLAIAGSMIFFFFNLGLIYLLANALFDRKVAVTSMFIFFMADASLRQAISGLPGQFLMSLVLIIFLLIYKLKSIDLGIQDIIQNVLTRKYFPDADDAVAKNTETDVTKSEVTIEEHRGHSAVGPYLYAIGLGLVLGLLFLTRYSTAVLLIPIGFFIMFGIKYRRKRLIVMLFLAFVLVSVPWMIRNIKQSRNPFGFALYTVVRDTQGFSAENLDQAIKPRMGAFRMRMLMRKVFVNMRDWMETEVGSLDKGLVMFLFAASIFHPFRRKIVTSLKRLALWGGIFMVGIAFFANSTLMPDTRITGRVLTMMFFPLFTIYGAAYFYVLLDRLRIEIKILRIGAIALFIVFSSLVTVLAILPPREFPPYPPYHIPFIKSIQRFMRADELTASDIPWAVAWYADRTCLWLPRNTDDFFEINDFRYTISAIYFTQVSLDRPLHSELLRGKGKSWFSVVNNSPPPGFPLLRALPLHDNRQMFISNVQRW